jgi:N-acetylmuramoyl-L-alanine amidase
MVEKKLSAYDGYSLVRVDDTTGETDVSLGMRVRQANNFGADFYLSVHHNAGINGGKGGGIVSIVYTNASQTSNDYSKIVYDEMIKTTGLKGNRSTPLAKQDLYVCRETKMPAVLVECGFMDSATDVPIILTENFADAAAEGIVNAIVKIGKLTKKAAPTEISKKIYRVQVGAYSVKANAEAMMKKLKADGYDAFIV